MFLYIAIAICGVLGFSLCLYILTHKQSQKPLVCPLEGSCEQVIFSKYSHLFGIPLEVLGITYYSVISLAYGAFALFNINPAPIASLILISISLAAFLVSVYLTSIQAFAIKHWCTWCLMSAGLSTIICIVSFISLNSETFTFIIDRL